MIDSSKDDRAQFERERRQYASDMAADIELTQNALDVCTLADRYHYTYQWSWLGLPIIQMPPDIVALQEVIWNTKPALVIETGIARGGSLIFSASILELIGSGKVVGVDVDIRPHNRTAIESHTLSHRIHMIEGSSVDPVVVAEVAAYAESSDSVMVVLDSNHTHDHVLRELHAYAPLVTPGQYLIVSDTVVEDIPVQTHRPRPWGPGNNPRTALDAFLATTDEFSPDEYIHSKLLMTSSPGGYLRRSNAQ